MEIGVHLPLMDFGDHPYALDHLIAYTTLRRRFSLHGAGWRLQSDA